MPDMPANMDNSPLLRDIDRHFSDFICTLEGNRNDNLEQAAGRLSFAVGQGHVCLDLAETFGVEASTVADALRLTTVTGSSGEFKPLILDGMKLYLYRYWKYENDLARAIATLAEKQTEVDQELLKDGLARLFEEQENDELDWQRIAAATAVGSSFSVISGGPGTGKTSTVVKIIILLMEQVKTGKIRVALAAPTGKAAARLKASLAGAREQLRELSKVTEQLPEEVSTIHRLLGVISGSNRFRHNADKRLPYDVIVIDEASMVPLPLMAKLMEAMAPQARLILLGDRDQLSSVDAGAVLGDICDTGTVHDFSPEFKNFLSSVGACTFDARQTETKEPGEKGTLGDAVIVLQKSYRFKAASGIGAVSRAINAGEGKTALELLKGGEYQDISIASLPRQHDIQSVLEQLVISGFGNYLENDDPATCLRLFDRFRVLCAMRQGSHGVAAINRAIESCLAAQGLIDTGRKWYRGRPVMVTVNDYAMKLFNGDIGIVFPDPDNPEETVLFFPLPDGGVRKISPFRIPQHETVYAMTVHKSQGSEFERVLMIMPPAETQLLSRELLYTGLTRAANGVEIWCDDEIFLSTVARRITRRSGLRQALWG